MNYKLSIGVKRPLDRACYVLDVSGYSVEGYVSRTHQSSLKLEIINTLAKGLRVCRKYLTHNDILYVEIQNRHLCNWLLGSVSYKEYIGEMDAVFDVVESLNCRIKFVFCENPYAFSYLANNDIVKLKGSSIANIDGELSPNEEVV